MSARIVVGVDGSIGSRHALMWAVEEATVRAARLEAVFVWQSPWDLPRGFDFYYPVDERDLAEGAIARLAEAIEGLSAGHASIEIESVVLEGEPGSTLCRRAEGADLLVVGSRGHGTVINLLIGSVSAKCAHAGPCPVAVVPSRHKHGELAPFASAGRVLVGVDGSVGSLRALRWAAVEATRRGAVLQACLVRRGPEAYAGVTGPLRLASLGATTKAQPDDPDDLRASRLADDRLKRAVSDALGESDALVDAAVMVGDPAEILCRAAAAADLLVVGARGHGSVGEILLGSVSDKCARHSPVPIVIVPADQGVDPSGARQGRAQRGEHPAGSSTS